MLPMAQGDAMPEEICLTDSDETEFLSLLTEQQRRFVEERSYRKFYHKHAIIHSPGDRVYHVNYILKGRIKIYNLSASGKEVIYRFCGANTFFGLAEICGEDRREVFAEAVEDTQTWCLERHDFLELLRGNHGVALFSLRVLGGRLRQAHRAIQSLAVQDTNSRLACLLLKLVEMGGKAVGGPVIDDKLTHQELASMIGATRTTVTEIINDYKEMKYIDYIDGKIRLLDFDKLREFAVP
jgi:CRP/FNR family transcriptional regulator, cyclic AMP receptor protein